MPANYVQDRSGNKYAQAVVINFTTMQRPTVAKALYDFIVPTDGTIDEALAAANSRQDKVTRFRVFIKNSDKPYVFHPTGKVTGGDGNEYDNPTSVLSAANTSFIGESMEGVVLTNVTPDATWNNGFGAACPLEGIGKELYHYLPALPADCPVSAVPCPVQHAADMACFGYILRTAEDSLYFSGDAAQPPADVVRQFLQGDIRRLYHDTASHESQAHCWYKRLEAAIPPEKRRDVYCMHLDGDYVQMLRELGFSVVTAVE